MDKTARPVGRSLLPLDLTSSEPSGSAARFLRIANAITLAMLADIERRMPGRKDTM